MKFYREILNITPIMASIAINPDRGTDGVAVPDGTAVVLVGTSDAGDCCSGTGERAGGA